MAFLLNAQPENSIIEGALVYVASKKPGGRVHVVSLCAGRCVKNGFYSTLNHHELDKSNNSADKDLSLSFFAHLIFIRKNEVITHLFSSRKP